MSRTWHPKFLLCTVGGSHEPVLTAIRALDPDHVVFVCTGRDPGTGRAGSEQQVVGKGLVVKARPEDGQPSLPNIAAQAGLAPDRFEVVVVPADDLDQAYAIIDEKLRLLRERHLQARIVADYTGGTKTMSAALVAAALDHQYVELQLVTGNRANLVRVVEGTQYAAPAAVDRIRTERAMAQRLQAWSRFAYEEAAQGLTQIPIPSGGELRARLARALDLSKAFAAWDRFDHREALKILQLYAPAVGAALKPYLGAAKILLGEQRAPREGLQIWDLWLNAQRRAAQGRFDDAVARAYRVLEWTAQWILRERAGLDTSNLPAERIPAGIVTANRDGRYQAGLYAAWQIVEIKTEGPAREFFRSERDTLRGHLEARNASILAHGFTPIDAKRWDAMGAWMEERFVPVLLAELQAAGIREVFPQLPDRPVGGHSDR